MACLCVALGIGTGVAIADFSQVQRTAPAQIFFTNRADINLDSRVNELDLRIVARHLGDLTQQESAKQAFASGDANLDGVVNVIDLALVGANINR